MDSQIPPGVVWLLRIPQPAGGNDLWRRGRKALPCCRGSGCWAQERHPESNAPWPRTGCWQTLQERGDTYAGSSNAPGTWAEEEHFLWREQPSPPQETGREMICIGGLLSSVGTQVTGQQAALQTLLLWEVWGEPRESREEGCEGEGHAWSPGSYGGNDTTVSVSSTSLLELVRKVYVSESQLPLLKNGKYGS